MSNSEPKIYELESKFAIDVLKFGWDLAKSNYAQSFSIVISIIAYGIALSLLPSWIQMVFFPIQAILSVGVGIGLLLIVQKWVENIPTKYSELFIMFNSTHLFLPLLPLIVVQILLMIPGQAYNFYLAGGEPGFLPIAITFLISILNSILFGFSAAQILFDKRTLGLTIRYNLKAVTKNWLPLVLIFALGLVLVLVSLICLVFPLFLVAIPILLTTHYLTYAAVFRGFEIPIKTPPTEPVLPPIVQP